MLLQNIPQSLGKKPKKEMLSYAQEPSGKHIVRINFSSLDLINTCKRKAYYVLQEKFMSNEESPATLFGTAIHKGLEAWYLSSKESRLPKSPSCTNQGTDHSCARCNSIKAFITASEPLNSMEIGDKRHPYNGIKILDKYFDSYLNDSLEIVRDEKGPIVERTVEFTLIDEPNLKVIFFGTIDCVLRNTETNVTYICDHKTTSALGSEFYNKVKPNAQYTGYVFLAQKCLNLETDLFLVNGIQVAKTKQEFARQVTQRTAEDIEEFTQSVRFAVFDYLRSKSADLWPQNSPGPCSTWGGCQFRQICEAPKSIKQNIIDSMYKRND